MAKIIKDMQLDEISLVDDPANPEATVLIAKAKSGAADDAVSAFLKEHNMDLAELEKALTDAQSALAASETVIKAKDAEISTLKTTVATLETAVQKSKEVKVEPTEEELLKSLPEPIRKRLIAMEEASKAQAEEIEKMRTEREETEAIEKARGLAGDPKVVGPALMRIRKGKATDADVAEIERLLKAANNQAATAGLFRARGATGDEPADPEAILKAKATEIQKANKGMGYETAYTQALDENPELYDAYIEKRRAPAA